MALAELATTVLLGLSSALHVRAIPPVSTPDAWTIHKAWVQEAPSTVFEASSSELVRQCQLEPRKVVQFPPVIQGAHEIFLDGQLLTQFGDPAFLDTRSFYGAPVVSCGELVHGREVTWRVYSYSRYFARFAYFPTLVASALKISVIAESFNLLAVGAFVTLALFTGIVFWRKEQRRLTLSIVGAGLAWSFYFGGTVPSLLGIHSSMLSVHKVADTGLWIGAALFFNALRIEKLIGSGLYLAYLAHIAVAGLIIWTSTSGDTIQFGTSIPFGLTLFIIFWSGVRLGRLLWRDLGRLGIDQPRSHPVQAIFGFISLLVFFVACVNDVLTVLGVLESYMLAAAGFIFGLLFFAFAISAKVDLVYIEKENYERNLERLVDERTAELERKTRQLESALRTLNETEVERQHTARLMSLGTLAAGIAHEINNSLNYVNGALIPVERLTKKLVPTEEFGKLEKLFGVMKEGLKLTFEIIRNLKSYSGVNQAQFADLEIEGVVRTVLTLIKGKLGERVTVVTRVEPGLKFYCNGVGINQVLMNLITNAVDAMPEGGTIEVAGRREGEDIVLTVSDSGAGMPPEVVDRIFDPFFTTKEVGSGTGLGLYIVRREVDRHKGRVQVRSEPGKGTTFILRFPPEAPAEATPGSSSNQQERAA